MTRHRSTHACAAIGCTEQIGRALLMCPYHWRQVPRFLQDTINRTWRAQDYQPYLRAVDEAIRLVGGNRPPIGTPDHDPTLFDLELP